MSRVLVTGANGFLGNELCGELHLPPKDIFLHGGRNCSDLGYISGDLSNPIYAIDLLENIKPTIIINLAAKVGFSGILSEYFGINVVWPVILSNYCRQNNSLLIHASSILVHGSRHEYYDASTIYAPDSAYGKTKLLADEVVLASGCESTILRFGGIFGKNGPSHLGINQSLLNAKSGIIPEIGCDFDTKRNYVFVKDAAKLIQKCMELRDSRIYYIGGDIISIGDMVTDICDILLPGTVPKIKGTGSSMDQIIQTNTDFNYTTFRDAVKQLQ